MTSKPDEPKKHWDEVYSGKAADQVSWFQPAPELSLKAIARAGSDHSTAIIDIGGGSSFLADRLLALGHQDITILDTAAPALELVKQRLGADAAAVHWIVADITHWVPDRLYGIWHDRAVFHFLTEEKQRAAYRRALDTGLALEGLLILATFAPDGPERCSGLPVCRYDAAQLSEALGERFLLVESWTENHTTPSGAVQPFTWALFRKR